MRLRQGIARLLFLAGLAMSGVCLYLIRSTTHVDGGSVWLTFAIALMAGSVVYSLAAQDPGTGLGATEDQRGPAIDLRGDSPVQSVPRREPASAR